MIEGKKKSAKAGRTEVRVEGATRNDSFGTAEAVPLTRPQTAVESTTGSSRFTCDGPPYLRSPSTATSAGFASCVSCARRKIAAAITGAR